MSDQAAPTTSRRSSCASRSSSRRAGRCPCRRRCSSTGRSSSSCSRSRSRRSPRSCVTRGGCSRSARSSSAKPVARPTTSSRQGGSRPSAWWSAPRWCARPGASQQTVVDDAEASGRQLRHEAEDYVDQKLAAFEVVLERTMQAVEKGRERLQVVIEADPTPRPRTRRARAEWRSCRARSRSRRSWKRRSSTRTPVRRISPRLADSGNRGRSGILSQLRRPCGATPGPAAPLPPLATMTADNPALRIDVADLLTHRASRRGVHLEAPLDSLAGSAAHVPDDQPVVLDLVLERVSDGVVVRGTVRALWRGTCGVCLTDLEHTLTPAVGELFEPSPSRATRTRSRGTRSTSSSSCATSSSSSCRSHRRARGDRSQPCEPDVRRRGGAAAARPALVGVVRTRPELRRKGNRWLYPSARPHGPRPAVAALANWRLAAPPRSLCPNCGAREAAARRVRQLRLVPRPPGHRGRLAHVSTERITIAIDAMGGDKAPDEIVRGALDAVTELGVDVLLVGQENAIAPLLPDGRVPGVDVEHAGDVVAMDEDPAAAARARRTRRWCVPPRPSAKARPGDGRCREHGCARWRPALLRMGRVQRHLAARHRGADPRAGRHPPPAAHRRRVDRRLHPGVARPVRAHGPNTRASPGGGRAHGRSALERRGAREGRRAAQAHVLAAREGAGLPRQRRGPRPHARDGRRHRHRRVHRQCRAQDARRCAARRR